MAKLVMVTNELSVAVATTISFVKSLTDDPNEQATILFDSFLSVLKQHDVPDDVILEKVKNAVTGGSTKYMANLDTGEIWGEQ